MNISATSLTVKLHLVFDGQSQIVVSQLSHSLGHQVCECHLFCLLSVLMMNTFMASLICTSLSKNFFAGIMLVLLDFQVILLI